VLPRARRHDGANVFAHLRDLAHSSGPAEEASHVPGCTIWPCCTGAHTTARRACLARSLVAGLAARTRPRVLGRGRSSHAARTTQV
jgi:hypothetical protein